MSNIAEFMSADHQACDEAFALAEGNALDNNWGLAEADFATFRNGMDRHFRREEEVLFPALLNANGPLGPVQVMRMEHAQINDLIEQMAVSLAARNSKGYSGLSETLLIVMQQHNLKEEQILYPIADRILGAERQTLISNMQAV